MFKDWRVHYFELSTWNVEQKVAKIAPTQKVGNFDCRNEENGVNLRHFGR
jgi:hypothetical protein